MKLKAGEEILNKVQISIPCREAVNPIQQRLNEIDKEMVAILSKADLLKKEYEFLRSKKWSILYEFYPAFDKSVNGESHPQLDFEDGILYEIKNSGRPDIGELLTKLFDR